MRQKLRAHRVAALGALGAVAALLLLVVGAWAYDNAQKDQIASGITVGGVDIGGRSAEEAREIVRTAVVAPLRQPVRVNFGGESYRLTARELRYRADIEGMVDEAIERSREGGFITRLGRYMSGSEVNADIPPDVTYSKQSVTKFVDEVAGEINQDPVDASIIPSGDTLSPQPGEQGIELREALMSGLITDQLDSPASERVLAARVKRTNPNITKSELAEVYPTYVTIDRANYTLRLFKNLRLKESYTIAVGQAGLETPSGLYYVQDKQVNPYWHVPNSSWAGSLAGTVVPPGPSNPLQARWIGIADGAGIHGTYDTGSLGTSASHGCVRMSIPEVIELYDQVPMGTPIYVQ